MRSRAHSHVHSPKSTHRRELRREYDKIRKRGEIVSHGVTGNDTKELGQRIKQQWKWWSYNLGVIKG